MGYFLTSYFRDTSEVSKNNKGYLINQHKSMIKTVRLKIPCILPIRHREINLKPTGKIRPGG